MTENSIYKLISLVFLFCSFGVAAINMTAYRIYLDQDNREVSFVMFNKDATPQQCSLSLIHMAFDAYGTMTDYQGEKLPENAADDWIRYSPKSFTVSPAEVQTVRFTLRRKANTIAKEYRSFLRVDCRSDFVMSQGRDNQNEKVVSISPTLRHNIPIVVRTGKLEVNASFNNFKLSNDILSFDLIRTGSRSLYGNIEVVNKDTGIPFVGTKSVSIYTETRTKRFSFPINGLKLEQLSVQFVEDERFGGNGVYQQDVVIN